MQKATLCCFVLLPLMAMVGPVFAQEAKSEPQNRFLLTGYGFANYVDPDAPDQEGSFSLGFSPIFLYRVGDKFLFEAELEFELEDDEVETEVEYAQIDWLANDYLTVVMGKFLTPFGTFIEDLHPAWINKLPTAPLPYQHGQSLVPFGQLGAQFRGGIPVGDGYRRFTYSLFLSNGMRMSEHGHEEEGLPEEDAHDEEESHEEIALLSEGEEHDEEHTEEGEEHDNDLIFLDSSSFNSNGSLAVGGRVSFVATRGIEIGASYLSGSYDEDGDLDATMFGINFTYHHDLFDIRGEWLDTTTERGIAEDGDLLADQEIEAWYIQPSLRLSIIPAYFFNKLEVVGRFSTLDFGEGDKDQTSLGLNYYFSGSSILRLAWERIAETGHEDEDAVVLMFALGF